MNLSYLMPQATSVDALINLARSTEPDKKDVANHFRFLADSIDTADIKSLIYSLEQINSTIAWLLYGSQREG